MKKAIIRMHNGRTQSGDKKWEVFQICHHLERIFEENEQPYILNYRKKDLGEFYFDAYNVIRMTVYPDSVCFNWESQCYMNRKLRFEIEHFLVEDGWQWDADMECYTKNRCFVHIDGETVFTVRMSRCSMISDTMDLAEIARMAGAGQMFFLLEVNRAASAIREIHDRIYNRSRG